MIKISFFGILDFFIEIRLLIGAYPPERLCRAGQTPWRTLLISIMPNKSGQLSLMDL